MTRNYTEITDDIRKKVVYFINEKKYTFSQVSEEMGISTTSISRIMTDYKNKTKFVTPSSKPSSSSSSTSTDSSPTVTTVSCDNSDEEVALIDRTVTTTFSRLMKERTYHLSEAQLRADMLEYFSTYSSESESETEEESESAAA